MTPAPVMTTARHARRGPGPDADPYADLQREIAALLEERDALLARQSELALSAERYARALEASGDGFWDWNVVTDDYYASPRMLEIYGFPPDTRFANRGEFLARSPVHPEDRLRWLADVDAHLAGRGVRFESEVRLLIREEVRWVRFSGIATRDESGRATRWAGAVSEVTARKEAETALHRSQDALRISEERHARAMEGSDAGHWDWDLTTDHMFVSERAKELLCLPPDIGITTRDDMMGRVPMHPDDRTQMGIVVDASLGGTSNRYEREYRVVHPDGLRWLQSRAVIFRDEQGRAVRMTGSLNDITERRRAEEALRMSEARYARAMDASEEGHWEWDVRTDDLYVSPRVLELFGFAADRTFPKRADLIAAVPYYADDLPGIQAASRAGIAGSADRIEFEYRVLPQPGVVRWLRARWKIARAADGSARSVTGVLTDVTARKNAETALRESEERFALAVAGSNEGIFDWNLATDQLYISQRAQQLFGLEPGAVWRPRREWRKLLTDHPDDVALQRLALHEHLAGNSPSYDVEFRVLTAPGGPWRWFHQRGIALRDSQGNAYRMVGSIGDVTERKGAQEDLLRMERQLRQAQRLEAMGTLAGGIAHDFNNILGAILGYGEMALRGAQRGTRLRRDLESIMTAGERGRALVDRILAFSRSGVSERIPVAVEDVVREALDLITARLPEGVAIEARLDSGRAAMLGDPTQVHQVLMNLATNAVQAMPSGGSLRVSLDAVTLDAPLAATTGSIDAGDYIVLEVADTGTGMPRDVLERIFDPFFTTKEVGVGTGLGLSLVHGIVSEVGGCVQVATTPGVGSSFIVYLPRSGDAAAGLAQETTVLPRGERQQVMVVDDEEPLTSLVTDNLRDLGYVPVGFTSSVAALDAFRAHPERFDALVTDERMPSMSGATLIAEIRKLRPGTPAVLVSGYVGSAVMSRAREVGANEVLKKPVPLHDLAHALARALRDGRPE